MKISLHIISLLLIIFSCKSGTETGDPACGHDVQCALGRAQSVCDQNTMVWLSDMLTKAEEDRISKTHKGNYIGMISLIRYKGQPVVYTNFALGSGGIAFYLFDCNGNPVSCEADDEAGKIPGLAMAKENVIYTSLIE
ncbi:hypothetical protein [Dyadobacter aurulentus]|uniref:hypothetical protein n=1 Tax=Dyadobacter sp. UC 10 TaxID=2605428 RepID=UPI0011F3B3B7|nr:hypothetical protein [Dyadobacter sp. UC 10]KAA0988729.1 hypothetical protein FXO21_00390 [Dyadobacter sp. UC 10]